MRGPVAVALAGALLAGTPRGQDSPPGSAIADPEAYAVYASLLPQEWLVRYARAKTLVVQKETVAHYYCQPEGGELDTDWRPVVDAFRAANARPQAIRAGESLGFPYIVVPAAEIDAIFDYSPSAWAWVDFNVRFPDSKGFIRVSAVGFDEDKKRAMVYMGHHCGGLCGGGVHHLLEKVDGQWRKAHLSGVTQCYWNS